MGAIEKTKAIKRIELPMHCLTKQKINPNKMSQREFDLLVDNMNRVGWIDPIFVRPVDEKTEDGEQMYRIVGGAHRYDVGAYLGFETAPCTVVDHEDFEEDEERFQIVRMNMIKGKLDPQKFFALYQEMSETYTDEVLQDAFGFADDAEWKRLIDQSAKTLPTPELQKKFKEAAKEVKDIDGLSKLLNEMFTKYGDSLPYGYMIVDYGGQRNVWLQVSKKTMDAVDLIGTICIDKSRTMDDVVGTIVQLIAKGELPEVMAKVIKVTPKVELPSHMEALPTKDNVAKVKALENAD